MFSIPKQKHSKKRVFAIKADPPHHQSTHQAKEPNMAEIDLTDFELALLIGPMTNAIMRAETKEEVLINLQNHLNSDILPRNEKWDVVVAKTMEGIEEAKTRYECIPEDVDVHEYRNKFDTYMFYYITSKMQAKFRYDWVPSSDEDSDDSCPFSNEEEKEDMDAESD